MEPDNPAAPPDPDNQAVTTPDTNPQTVPGDLQQVSSTNNLNSTLSTDPQISSGETVGRALLTFLLAVALIVYGTFNIGIVPTVIIVVVTLICIGIILKRSRKRRDKYFQITGTKSYIAAVRASQLQGLATNLRPNKWVAGSLLVITNNNLRWEPSKLSAKKGATAFEFPKANIQSCKVANQFSLVPAKFLFFTLNDGKTISFSVTDSRDLRAVLQQNGIVLS